MKSLKNISNQVLLVILDGFGISENSYKNAVKDASTPCLDGLFQDYPFTTIKAGGSSVGLPEGVMGNSEVGHMNIGAGRPVRQDLVRINEAIGENLLKDRPKFKELLNHSSTIHLMGPLSDGGVHSHIDHIGHIARQLINEQKTVYLHAFTDGRDTERDCAEKYIDAMENINGLQLASIQGRSISMDRDRRWDKTHLAYKTLTGQGTVSDLSPKEWIRKEYAQGRFDEFITPVLFNKDYAIKQSDALFFVNFRPDRAVQLTLAFTDPKFKEFDRDFIASYFLCMTPYVQEEVELPVLFDREPIKEGLSEYLSKQNLKQFKVAETEKYPHITYFFNGGQKEPHFDETFHLIPSPKDCQTYDQKPQMSAYKVCDRLLQELETDTTFFLVNFANGDMVGHTGNYEATLKAIEVLDQCIEKLMKACEKRNITMILTADHGNSDCMAYADGSPHTSHTNAPVPFSVFHPLLKDVRLLQNKGDHSLKDIAPTILHILGIDPPKAFTGTSVFQ